MMRSIAVELATHGINVNGIETAWIDTPGEYVIFREETIAEKKRLQRRFPIAVETHWTA